jgi:23S rRNA (uracil1939-C5)-methyltransferase
MTADEVFKVRLEGIASGGAALARIGGKNVFIGGGAAGELAVCRLTEAHRSWARAELLEIIEASPDRTRPRCDFYGICGGCNLQHISYGAQLAAKTAILKDAFVRIGHCRPPEPEVFPAEPWEYRNRMQLHRSGAGTGVLGLKARKSGDVIPVSDCPIADPGIRAVLRKAAGGERALPLPPEKDRFTVYARNGLLLSEGGTERGRTSILDRAITLDSGVFFQSNGAMLEKLAADLREIAGGINAADREHGMADLYCGVGTFAALLGDLFSRADLVEENKNALALARENVKNPGTEFFALRANDWLRLKRRGGDPYGFMVLDPPRQGLSPSLAAWLAGEGPPLLAYVSCDPAALARDSGILVRGGYEIACLRLYDFYPQTAHIESLALFRKA